MCLRPQPVLFFFFTRFFQLTATCRALQAFSESASQSHPLRSWPERDELLHSRTPIQNDEDDEPPASDYIMGKTKDNKKPKSDRQEEDIPMERADYDRDSDSDEDKKPPEPPLEERPRQKAMPMRPPVPPLGLTQRSRHSHP